MHTYAMRKCIFHILWWGGGLGGMVAFSATQLESDWTALHIHIIDMFKLVLLVGEL